MSLKAKLNHAAIQSKLIEDRNKSLLVSFPNVAVGNSKNYITTKGKM